VSAEPPYFRTTDGPDTLIARPMDETVLVEIGRPGPSGGFELAGAVCLDPAEVMELIDALRQARRLIRQRRAYHRRANATAAGDVS
jgi:hypothetical protein